MHNLKNITLFHDISATIRHLRIEDINSEYLNALNDPRRTHSMSYSYRPQVTEETLKNYVQKSINSDKDYLFGLFLNNTLMATSRLHDSCISSSSIWQGVFVFTPQSEGKGYGSLIVGVVSDFALIKLGYSAVKAAIKNNNIASKKCFQKSGFRFSHVDDSYQNVIREIWTKTK